MLGIVIITYNIPTDVFVLQLSCIKRFCKDWFEIIIVDNSSDKEKTQAIEYHSLKRRLKYIRTQTESVGSDSHAFAANFAYNELRTNYDYFLFLDHDCIPVKEFSVEEILEDKVMAGLGQQKTKLYFWPGCVMWDNNTILRSLIDFSTNSKHGLDTGGELYKVIEEYGKERCVFFDEVYHENPAFRSPPYNFYAMLNKGVFLHFINGSGWNGNSEERINSLINITNGLISA